MSLKIKFVTDYVCPYCLVAKVPLLEAVKGKDIEIEWIPYEVTQEPAPRVDTYHDETRREKWAKTLVPAAKALGLEMKLPPKVIPRPYTRLAFEGWHFAVEHGFGETYNNRMYEAYFMDELDIGDVDVLCRLAGEIGLDAEKFGEALNEGTYRKKQEACVAYARDVLHVKAVPTIFISKDHSEQDTKIEGGVYTKEGFEALINEALLEQDGREIIGMSCDIHGNCG